jgi:hypothetical protein
MGCTKHNPTDRCILLLLLLLLSCQSQAAKRGTLTQIKPDSFAVTMPIVQSATARYQTIVTQGSSCTVRCQQVTRGTAARLQRPKHFLHPTIAAWG